MDKLLFGQTHPKKLKKSLTEGKRKPLEETAEHWKKLCCSRDETDSLSQNMERSGNCYDRKTNWYEIQN